MSATIAPPSVFRLTLSRVHRTRAALEREMNNPAADTVRLLRLKASLLMLHKRLALAAMAYRQPRPATGAAGSRLCTVAVAGGG